MVMIRPIHRSAWLFFTADPSLCWPALCLQMILTCCSIRTRAEYNLWGCWILCSKPVMRFTASTCCHTDDGLHYLHVSMRITSDKEFIVGFSRELGEALWYRLCCLLATQHLSASVVSHLWLSLTVGALNSNISLMIAFSRELGIIFQVHCHFSFVQVLPLHFCTVLMTYQWRGE